MNDCDVCIGGFDVDLAASSTMATPKARKEHRCSECLRTILKGEIYQRVSLLDRDYGWETFITCATCAEIRKAFTCDGPETFGGMLWNDMVDYAFPDLNESCFDKLQTVEAKKYLRERWMKWKGLL